MSKITDLSRHPEGEQQPLLGPDAMEIGQSVATTEQEGERERFTLWRKLRSPRTLISFGIAFAIILFVFHRLDIDPQQIVAHVQGANLGLLLTGLAVFYLTFPLRAIRWRLLLTNANVPIHRGGRSWASLSALMEYIYLSWFANCIIPAKLGDAYRGYLLKHNGNVSFSASIGTIFAERLLDMLVLFGLLVICGWYTFGMHLPGETHIVFGFGFLLVVLILIGLAGMHWLSPFIHRAIHLVDRISWVKAFFARACSEHPETIYGRFERAALRSFRPAILPHLVLLTVGVWLLEGFRLFFVIQALGNEGLAMSIPSIIFVALASSLLTALPLTPAGLGVIEGTVTVILVKFFSVEQHLAGAVTFLDRMINFWSIVVFGFLLYLVSKRK